jgi:hypothetical protein
MSESTVTCHTDGCANAGAPIAMLLSGVDADGNPWAADSVVCGVCRQPVTDVE